MRKVQLDAKVKRKKRWSGKRNQASKVLTVHVGELSSCEFFVAAHNKVEGNIASSKKESLVENAGIDPATSRMLSERSTI